MVENLHGWRLATTFLGSLLCGGVGAACVLKIATNLMVMVAGDSLDAFSDGGNIWTWPRDRGKIAAVSLGAALIAVVCFALSYVLANRAFNGVS